MTIADIGAGTGFITVELVRRVGSRGLVVATDLQIHMLNTLRSRPNLPNNIIIVLSTSTDTRLPSNTD